jgi:molecular chaperone GrpE
LDERKNEQIQSEYDKENALEANSGADDSQKADDAENKKNEKHHAEKGGLHKEVLKLQEELGKAIEERDLMTDKYQRTFSDFNNYKKRNEALAYQAMKTGECDTIEKILPVLDNMERALEHVSDKDEDAVAKGVSMVYKQLSDIIAGMGVTEIPALGMEFDPNLHQAIQQVEAGEGETPGTIAAVAQKGYMQGDKVLRHSMVIVNK